MTGDNTTETGTKTGEWITREEIAAIPGALLPSAYVQRAYLHTKENNNTPPPWAKRGSRNKWLFLRAHIEADAQPRLQIVTATEAAQLLGVSRRCVQNWVDTGVIPLTDPHQPGKGEVRHISRQYLLENLDALKQRLMTPAVIGARLKTGKPVPPDALARFRSRRPPGKRAPRPAARHPPQTDVPTPSAQPAPSQPLQTASPATVDSNAPAPTHSLSDTQPVTAAPPLPSGKPTTTPPPRPEVPETPPNTQTQSQPKHLRSDLLEQQLRQAQATALAPPANPATATTKPDPAHTNTARASAIEEHLRHTSKVAMHLERIATDLAQKVEADIIQRGWPRLAGVILFNRLAADAGIPKQTQLIVRKKYFGH